MDVHVGYKRKLTEILCNTFRFMAKKRKEKRLQDLEIKKRQQQAEKERKDKLKVCVSMYIQCRSCVALWLCVLSRVVSYEFRLKYSLSA